MILVTLKQRISAELGNMQVPEMLMDIFIQEEGLSPDGEYKTDDKRSMLKVCLEILESIGNDLNTMRTVKTDFLSTSEATQNLQQRISDLKKRIAEIDRQKQAENSNQFTCLYKS